MQRDFRGQLDFVVSAEPLSPSCFPELLLTNYLRPGCDSRAEVFALNICQPGCQGSAISPSYNSVTFTIKPTGNTSLLVSVSGNWGWIPPLMSVCAPHQCSHTALSLLRGLARGPILPPHSPWSQLNGHLDLCLSALKMLVVSALPSPFPHPLAVGKEQLEGRARSLWPCCGTRAVHQCHWEPPETLRVLTQLSWLELVFCTQNELK